MHEFMVKICSKLQVLGKANPQRISLKRFIDAWIYDEDLFQVGISKNLETRDLGNNSGKMSLKKFLHHICLDMVLVQESTVAVNGPFLSSISTQINF